MSNQTSIDSLAAGLIQMIGSYFERIAASPSRPLSEFDASDSKTSIYVIYSASGMPLSVGHVGRNTTRGRQAPPADIMSLRSTTGTTFRVIEVGDEVLAANLTRLMVDLFSTMLPFSTSGTDGDVVVDREEQVTEAPKRRGRPARKGAGKKGAAKGGRKRGRRAAAIQGAAQDGAAEVVAEAPRRRGRKPGSKNKPKVKTGGDASSSAPAKRMGRPPGSKNKSKAQSGGSVTNTPKKRGRPFGSKNKPKA